MTGGPGFYPNQTSARGMYNPAYGNTGGVNPSPSRPNHPAHHFTSSSLNRYTTAFPQIANNPALNSPHPYDEYDKVSIQPNSN
jgi:hypothetical protein